jgi:hypothetical protein
MINNLNVFSTRIITMEEIFNDLELLDILNKAKQESPYIEDEQEHFESLGNLGSPTYRTSYAFANIQEELFEPVKTKIINALAIDSLTFEFSQAIWWNEYGEYDQHGPHTHDQKQWDMMQLHDALKYSGIINLSDIGKTMFVNPNPASFNPQEISLNSTYGSLVLFPSNIWHYVPQHRESNKLRRTFAFNGLLRGLNDLDPNQSWNI